MSPWVVMALKAGALEPMTGRETGALLGCSMCFLSGLGLLFGVVA
jgi:hypothetical protein